MILKNKTDKGIKIGSTWTVVIAAYGEPDQLDSGFKFVTYV